MSDQKIIKAPFTAEQQQLLNEHQANPQVHSYTCRNCGDPLYAMEHWVCRGCDYTQDWAHNPTYRWELAGRPDEEWEEGWELIFEARRMQNE